MPLSFLPQKKFHWKRPLLAVFFILLVFVPTVFFGYEYIYTGRIYPGVKVGVLSIGGKTKKEAETFLREKTDQLIRGGFPFVADTKRITITPILSAPTDPDVTYDLISWDIETSVERAYAVGRATPAIQRWQEQFWTLVSGMVIPIDATMRRDEMMSILQENFGHLERLPRDAALVYHNGILTIQKEETGIAFKYEQIIKELDQQIKNITSIPIHLVLETKEPAILEKDAEQALRDAQILSGEIIRFTFDTRWWRFQPEAVRSWLMLKKGTDGIVIVGLMPQTLKVELDKIATDINVDARDAKFTLKNGRVTEFVSSREGRRLDIDQTITALENALRSSLRDEKEELDIPLQITRSSPRVRNEDVNTFGIAELIGVGKSNFAGSPTNRRHNIRIGAAALHGLLISPGEEFSLIKALGDIDAKSGYRPELVIKGNRTIPEFGGGLCQIGTTTFRAALGSGLPITERRNHSYNVSYYLENGKPGTDATIYGPHPDLRFVNDTGTTILFQTRIEGDNLVFEFWGKKDGRVARRTEPIVSNIRKPGPTKIIETTDLPPGQKKCTERSHNGATAEFTYTVTDANGETKEKVFKSYYRPWQAVCLVGIAPEQKTDTDVSESELPSADVAGARGE